MSNPTLSVTAKELVAQIMLTNGIPQNESLVISAFMLAFVRQLMIDCRSMIPDRENTVTYELPYRGYNSVPIPNDCYDIISVGTQIGRYVKQLAQTGYLTNRKPTNPLGLVPPNNFGQGMWYTPPFNWGWGLGVGMGWAGAGNYPGLEGWGNGMNYGEFNIDWGNRKIYTSGQFPFTNLVVQYYTNCVTPSEDTVIHPFFITAAEHYVMHRYKLSRGEAALSNQFLELWRREYGDAIVRKNKTPRQTVLKILNRIQGK